MQRRHFLKSSCNICLLGAAGFALPKLTGCSPALHSTGVYKATIVGNAVEIPLVLFEKTSLQIVRPLGWFYDIAVEKRANNTYAALLLQCTHQDNQLTASGTGYSCSLHGSQFDKNGNVLKGPAEDPLRQYKTTIGNNTLIIEVPKTP